MVNLVTSLPTAILSLRTIAIRDGLGLREPEERDSADHHSVVLTSPPIGRVVCVGHLPTDSFGDGTELVRISGRDVFRTLNQRSEGSHVVGIDDGVRGCQGEPMDPSTGITQQIV